MAKIPQYQRQVGPGSYRGPTPLQVQQTFEGMDSTESAAAMIGSGLMDVSEAAMVFAQNLMEVRNKAKAAYDVSQLSKAEKTYWSMMNNAVEIDIPNSGKPITDWDEMYDKADKEAMAAASKLLEDSTQTLMFGGPQQKTVADDLEAFQLNYNTQFRVNLYQKQSKALLDVAAKVMQSDLVQLRDNPDYLPVALQHIDNYIANFPGFSQEAGEKQKDKAKGVARIATHYKNFDKLAEQLGSVDDAYAWYTKPTNTPDFSDEERDRFLQTMARHVDAIHSIAENNLNERVDKTYMELVDMFFEPEKGEYLTPAIVKKEMGVLKDKNAKNATEESNDKQEHLYLLLKNRDEALKAGKEDPANMRNNDLILGLQWSIRERKRLATDDKGNLVLDKNGKVIRTNDPASKQWIERVISKYIGLGIDQTGLNYLDGDLNQYMPNKELERAISDLEAAKESGLITVAQFGEASTIITNTEIEYRQREKDFGAENVKPVDPSYYANFTQNFLDNAYMKKKDKSKASRAAQDWMNEAKQTKWFATRGASAGVRDIDAFIELSENGNLAGLAKTSEWDPYYRAAEAEIGNMLIGNILGKKVTNASYVASTRPGVNVFNYKDPETGNTVSVEVARFSNGKMVYSFPVTEEIVETLPSGEGRTWVYQKQLYLSPTHNIDTDKNGFALYDPASDSYLMGKDGEPVLYTFPMAPNKPPSDATGLRRVQEQIESAGQNLPAAGDIPGAIKRLEESGKLW